MNDDGLYEISDEGFQFIKIDGHDPDGNLLLGDFAYSTYMVIGSNEDNYLVASQPEEAKSNDEVYVGGGDGSDIIDVSANKAYIEAGEGDDIINVSVDAGNITIFGDIFAGDSGGTINSSNTDFSDSVYLEWQKSEVTLSNPSEGYFRIEHAGTGSVVDIYDVENLYFSDGSGGYEYKPLTEGQVIGKAHWQGDAAGMDIEFEQHNVSFQVDGDVLKVLASATVMVTEEQFTTDIIWTLRMGATYRQSDYPGVVFADYGFTQLSRRDCIIRCSDV